MRAPRANSHDRLSNVVSSQLDPAPPDLSGHKTQGLEGVIVGAGCAIAACDMDNMELGLESGGDSRSATQHRFGTRRARHRHHDALAWLPRCSALLTAQEFEQLLFRLVGEEPESELTKRDEVLGSEEVVESLWNHLRCVDFTVEQSSTELLGRGVDQLYLVGSAHHRIRHTFVHRRSRQVFNCIRNALEVLNVDCRNDVDPRLKKFEHLLPALLVFPRAGHDRVRELINKGEPWLSQENCVEIHLLKAHASIGNLAVRDDLKPIEQRFSGWPAVTLGIADHDVDSVLAPPLALA